MNEFVWLLLGTVAFIWIAATVIVLVLGAAAHRGDPRVVMEDPWDQPVPRQAWDQLREAVAQANADLERERSDFMSWEREVRVRRARRAA
jgi:hypothetical protein